MRENYIKIITMCILIVLVGFISGYEGATYNVKVGEEVSSVKKEIRDIDIKSLDFKDNSDSEIATLEFNLTYNLRGIVDLNTLKDYLSFKFIFSDKTKDILEEEITDKITNYSITAERKSSNEYNLSYIFHLKSIKKEDIEYIKANYKKDTQLHIFVENKVFKKIKFN